MKKDENKNKAERKLDKKEETNTAAFLGGGAAGAVAGAAVGSVAGPAGTVVGAAVGGIAAAKAAEGMASMPDNEESFWGKAYKTRPYAQDGASYEDFAPAYRAGYAASCQYGEQGRSFEEVEPDIRRNYESQNREGDSCLEWDRAREAARDSYNRSLQLREERLRAEKERVESGEVRLRKEVVSDTETLEVPVEREEVVVERHALSSQEARKGEISDDSAEEVARIPVSEERIRIEKETVPTEEVSLKKEKVVDTERVSGTVRREEARIEREGQPRVREEREEPRAR